MLAAWLPRRLARRPLSLPIVLVAIGASSFALTGTHPPSHIEDAEWIERATELGVLVSLMGAGLKLDRPIGWKTWGSVWRLLAIGMPLTIALGALSGVAIGLPLSSALLVGACLAPTDPVLAAEVQVGEPSTGAEAEDADEEDDARFALTGEAGLNDGLAFPFVYAAIALADSGGSITLGGIGRWIAVDLALRIGVAVVIGWIIGRALGGLLFSEHRHLRLADSATGFVAVAATLLAYGATELMHGYGFIGVFVAALTMRSSERSHEYHNVMHNFADEIEQLLIVGLLVIFGGALATDLLDGINLGVVAVAAFSIFVARPAACRVALIGTDLMSIERRTVSFFGIRGIGSLYYVAYATTDADFAQTDELWAIVGLTVAASILIHGVAATPVMVRLDRRRARRDQLRTAKT